MGVAVVAAWGGLSATIWSGRALIGEKKLAHGRCASDNGGYETSAESDLAQGW